MLTTVPHLRCQGPCKPRGHVEEQIPSLYICSGVLDEIPELRSNTTAVSNTCRCFNCGVSVKLFVKIIFMRFVFAV